MRKALRYDLEIYPGADSWDEMVKGIDRESAVFGRA